MRTMKNKIALLALAAATLALGGCSSEMVNDAAPVELVVTNTQNLHRLDIDPLNGDDECNENVGTINMAVIAKGTDESAGPFEQVRVRTYRVSYRRIDGGTLVPAPFVRPIDTLIAVGGDSGDTVFQLAEAGIFDRAPFAALQPQNGGVDAETGKRSVTLQVIVEVFGETLNGDDVYDATSFPLEFCYGCGGCD